MQDLQVVVGVVVSLAERGACARANGQLAPAAVTGGSGTPEHLADRAGAVRDARVDVAVAHDRAVAQDHKVRLT
jgi:hypothetical protein